jgi:hypothetical protein
VNPIREVNDNLIIYDPDFFKISSISYSFNNIKTSHSLPKFYRTKIEEYNNLNFLLKDWINFHPKEKALLKISFI